MSMEHRDQAMSNDRQDRDLEAADMAALQRMLEIPKAKYQSLHYEYELSTEKSRQSANNHWPAYIKYAAGAVAFLAVMVTFLPVEQESKFNPAAGKSLLAFQRPLHSAISMRPRRKSVIFRPTLPSDFSVQTIELDLPKRPRASNS